MTGAAEVISGVPDVNGISSVSESVAILAVSTSLSVEEEYLPTPDSQVRHNELKT